VAYARLHGIKATVEKYNVKRRTLHRWVSDGTSKTAHRATELTHAAGEKWAAEVLGVAAAVIVAGGEVTLKRLAGGAKLEAKELHAWAGAMKLANDAITTQQLLDERTKPSRAEPPPKPKPAAVVPIGGREEQRRCA
jgi:hypothetical protein